MERTTPPNLDGLVRLSRREGVDIRPALLRVLTDLYVREKSHTRDGEQQYSELALHMLPLVDVPTRVAVASKLARYRLAPAAVLDHLANDIAEVAALLHDNEGPRVSGEEHGWMEPARPSDAIRPSARPYATTDRPGRLRPNNSGNGTPSGDQFLRADSAERHQILERLEQLLPPANGDAPGGDTSDTIERLEKTALARDPREFARELQSGLRITPATAARIANDPFGEPVLIAAKALGMPSPMLQRILLFLEPAIGQSVERVFALSRLYDDLSPQAALHLVADWRESAARRGAARYAGVHADEAGYSAAGLMDNARRSASGRISDAIGRKETAKNTTWRQRRT